MELSDLINAGLRKIAKPGQDFIPQESMTDLSDKLSQVLYTVRKGLETSVKGQETSVKGQETSVKGQETSEVKGKEN